MTQIVSGLVRELVCVESWVLDRNGLLQTRGICSKKPTKLSAVVQGPFLLSSGASEEGGGGHNLLPHRVPLGLIKGVYQRLREVAVPRETQFNRGTKLP